MLGILLKILSIIGISLVVILLVLLLIVAIILFSPITYRLQGEKDAGESFWGKVKATYLFGMIRIKYAYPDPGKLVIKLLCFTLYDTSKPKNKKKKKRKEKKKQASETTVNESGTVPEYDTKIIEIDTGISDKTESADVLEEKEIVTKEFGEDQEKATEKLDDPEKNADMDEGKDMFVDNNDKVSIKDKIKRFFEKIRTFENKLRNFIHNTKNKTEKIKQKISKTYHEISFYKELATGKEGTAFLEHVKKRVIKILKVVRPRKYRVKMTFGADSPDITGYVVAGYSMIYPRIRKPNKFELETDFTQSVFEGTFDIKGHFMLFTIVINGLMLLLDRNFKSLRHKLKRHKKANAGAFA